MTATAIDSTVSRIAWAGPTSVVTYEGTCRDGRFAPDVLDLLMSAFNQDARHRMRQTLHTVPPISRDRASLPCLPTEPKRLPQDDQTHCRGIRDRPPIDGPRSRTESGNALGKQCDCIRFPPVGYSPNYHPSNRRMRQGNSQSPGRHFPERAEPVLKQTPAHHLTDI